MEVRTEEIIWNRQAEIEMFSKKKRLKTLKDKL